MISENRGEKLNVGDDTCNEIEIGAPIFRKICLYICTLFYSFFLLYILYVDMDILYLFISIYLWIFTSVLHFNFSLQIGYNGRVWPRVELGIFARAVETPRSPRDDCRHRVGITDASRRRCRRIGTIVTPSLVR